MFTAVRRYRMLFAVPGATRVLFPSIVGRLPIGMSTLLFVLVVYAGTGSYPVAGLATAVNSALVAVTAPVLGRLADRGRAVAVLFWSGLIQAAALTTLVAALRLGMGDALVVALAGAAGAANPPIGAVTRVLLPRLGRAEELGQAAYAFDALVVELSFVAGPMVVGVVATVADVYAATVAAAVLTLVGAWGLASAPLLRATYRNGHTSSPSTSHKPPARPRLGALASGGLRTLLLIIALEEAAYGVMEVAIPAYAQSRGHADLAGLVVAVWSLGSIVGGLWYSGQTFRMPLPQQFALLMTLNVAGFGVLLLATGLTSLGMLLFCAGLVISPTTAVEIALTGTLAPVDRQTEAFTWASTSIYLGFAGGSALAGAVLSPTMAARVGLRGASILAVGLIAAGAAATVLGRRSLNGQRLGP